MRPTRWAGGSKVGTSIQLGKTRTPPRDNFGVIGDRQCQGDDGRIQSSETLSTICLVTDVKLSGGFVRLARSFIGPEMMHPPIRALPPPEVALRSTLPSNLLMVWDFRCSPVGKGASADGRSPRFFRRCRLLRFSGLQSKSGFLPPRVALNQIGIG